MEQPDRRAPCTRRPLTTMLLVAALGCSQFASADLMNSDFSDGFNGWQAEVTSYNLDTATDTTLSGDIFADFSDNFSLSGDEVSLSTTASGNQEFWNIVLFQDFVVDSLDAGQSLTLSLDISSQLTDELFDFSFAQLRNLQTNDVLDLSSGGSFDISTWAGVNASLEFGVQDGDFILGDSLSFSGLSIMQSSTIPEPATLLLFGLGALALTRKRN
ncbi:PEP-CTERM sorting domain-containing protein [Lacimicrobium alkaliphilum]|uniref:Ice-binding protein C-terminal domain-containing protein n=1 Tax=Lacimicrobium alkaliphilum TaxID=1526571 RepID=A0ABQ1QYJ3_9ALTE|nr:PEP-CTERM sorting domain-containing protein [Lacimicrobium alkaliphilum]GGD51843.1 hypothetical protein GCM10011357_04680 [Lacimicrobium alkaliphilum]